MILTLLLFITGVAKLLLTSLSSESVSYRDPALSQQVVGGTVFDSEMNILAMEVPTYRVETDNNALKASFAHLTDENNCIYPNKIDDAKKLASQFDSVRITETEERVYPSGGTLYPLIRECELEFNSLLFPAPEVGTSKPTLGRDIKLSVDAYTARALDKITEAVAVIDCETKRPLALSSRALKRFREPAGGTTAWQTAQSFAGSTLSAVEGIYTPQLSGKPGSLEKSLTPESVEQKNVLDFSDKRTTLHRDGVNFSLYRGRYLFLYTGKENLFDDILAVLVRRGKIG